MTSNAVEVERISKQLPTYPSVWEPEDLREGDGSGAEAMLERMLDVEPPPPG